MIINDAFFVLSGGVFIVLIELVYEILLNPRVSMLVKMIGDF